MKVKKTSWKKVISLCLILSVLLTSQGKWQTPQSLEAKESAVTRDEVENQEEIQGVIAEKTESATIYDLGNGTKRAEIYAGDVRYKEKNGEIVDYDTSLIENQETVSEQGNDVDGYAYKTKQSEKVSYFPEKVNEKTPIMTEYEEYMIKITPAEKVKKTSANREMVEDLYDNKEKKITSVDYESKTEDTNYRYESTNDGVKETIILEEPTENNQFDFSVTLKNCGFVTQEDLKKDSIDKLPKKLETRAGEDLYLYDIQEKKLVGAMPAAFMLDGEGTYSEDCSYQVKQEKKSKNCYEYSLVLTVSKEYLKDEKRVYPISIDPSFVWDSSNSERFSSAYVCSTAPTKTYTDSGTNILCVGGRDSSKDICRAYMKFEGINSILEGYYLDSATLDLNFCQTNVGMKMYVRQVDSAWHSSTITYNTQPKRKELELADFTTTSMGGQVSIPLHPETLDDCVREEEPIYGFEITDSIDDSNTKSTKTAWIYNGKSVNGARVPKLTVVYEDKSKLTDFPHVSYQVCGNAKGAWSTTAQDGEMAGGTTKSNYARAIKMSMEANGYSVGNVKFRAYCEGATNGWTSWSGSGAIVGNATKAGKIKAIQMKAYNDEAGTVESTKYNIYYRVYVPGRGWLGWAKNGGDSGDYTSTGCVSAIQAILVPKVYYGIEYTTPTGEIDYDEDLESEFATTVDCGAKLFSIGVGYRDYEMRCNHPINVQVTQKDGTKTSKKSVTTYELNLAGGDAQNKIIGYNMEFVDKTMRSRYNIEHVASRRGLKGEERWTINRRYSGLKTTGNSLETMSLRIVPKGYKHGQRACYSDKFQVSEDGYSFINTWADFSYPSGYIIPREKYVALLGEVWAKEAYSAQLKRGGWGGGCYGMSMSSVLYYSGFWDCSLVASNIDITTETVYGLYKQPYKKDKKMRDVIEYLQISQTRDEIGRDKEYTFSSTNSNIKAVVERLIDNPQGLYVMYIGRDGGNHVVVPIKVTKKQTGEYQIDLYDPNCPGEIQHAIVNKEKTIFQYGTYDIATLRDVDEAIKTSPGMYEIIMNNSVNGVANPYRWEDLEDVNTIIAYGCTSLTITDEQGNNISDSEEVSVNYSIDDPNKVVYTVPVGEYEINVEKPQKDTSITVLNYDVSVNYNMSEAGKIDVAFGKDKVINSSIDFLNSNSKNVTVSTYDKHKNKRKITYYNGKKIVTCGKDNKSTIMKIK